jgi:hypothetical protein
MVIYIFNLLEQVYLIGIKIYNAYMFVTSHEETEGICYLKELNLTIIRLLYTSNKNNTNNTFIIHKIWNDRYFKHYHLWFGTSFFLNFNHVEYTKLFI